MTDVSLGPVGVLQTAGIRSSDGLSSLRTSTQKVLAGSGRGVLQWKDSGATPSFLHKFSPNSCPEGCLRTLFCLSHQPTGPSATVGGSPVSHFVNIKG